MGDLGSAAGTCCLLCRHHGCAREVWRGAELAGCCSDYADRWRWVGAWRLTLNAPKKVSVLWALVHEAKRHRIGCAHTAAVKRALGSSERSLTGHESWPPREKRAAALFATFRSGADQHQNPDLRSTVFFINFGLQRDGRWAEFSTGGVRPFCDGCIRSTRDQFVNPRRVQQSNC